MEIVAPVSTKHLISNTYALQAKNSESFTGSLLPLLNVVDPSYCPAESRSVDSATSRFPTGCYFLRFGYYSPDFPSHGLPALDAHNSENPAVSSHNLL